VNAIADSARIDGHSHIRRRHVTSQTKRERPFYVLRVAGYSFLRLTADELSPSREQDAEVERVAAHRPLDDDAEGEFRSRLYLTGTVHPDHHWSPSAGTARIGLRLFGPGQSRRGWCRSIRTGRASARCEARDHG
jgi:hypothetical protein